MRFARECAFLPFAQEAMAMVGFPLLLIPLAVYNIIVFLMPSVSLSEPVLRLTLMSGAEWPITSRRHPAGTWPR